MTTSFVTDYDPLVDEGYEKQLQLYNETGRYMKPDHAGILV